MKIILISGNEIICDSIEFEIGDTGQFELKYYIGNNDYGWLNLYDIVNILPLNNLEKA